MESSNPILTRTFRDGQSQYLTGERMSVNGTVNKTGLLLTLATAAAAWPWYTMVYSGPQSLSGFLIGGGVVGFILAMVVAFKPHLAPTLAPVYAGCEGLVLGGLSAILEMQYPGIALQAIAATMGTLGVMLLAYKFGVVRATENFKLGVIAATGGIAVIYLVSMVAGFFGVHVPFVHSNGLLGIGFSAVVVIVAALNLVLDFDLIEQGAKAGAPKYMEWYGAFALMVTLVWLYLEILRLLSKVRSRD